MSRDSVVRLSVWVAGLVGLFILLEFIFPIPIDTVGATLYWASVGVAVTLFSVGVWLGKFIGHVIEPKSGDSRQAFILIITIAFAAIPLVMLYAVTNKWEENKLGSLGDFFGGVLNPILTFLTFVGLLITIVLQQREIHNGKEAAKDLAIERKDERKLAESQRFETTFFQMLTLHNSLVNAMDLRTRTVKASAVAGMEWHGRDCFPRFYEHLKTAYKAAEKRKSPEPLREAYSVFWKQDQKDLAHYFRFLYNIIRVVDEAQVEKKTYIRLLRAQISDYELLILFYNGMFEKGRHFRPYIEKYALFDNLPEELLLDVNDMDNYSDDAFFDAKVERTDAKKFLDGWVHSYILAESREPSELNSVMEELLIDSKVAGVTLSKLVRAAGNDLEAHVLAALRKASGEE